MHKATLRRLMIVNESKATLNGNQKQVILHVRPWIIKLNSKNKISYVYKIMQLQLFNHRDLEILIAANPSKSSWICQYFFTSKL